MPRRRIAARLSEPVDRQLNSYALAATAAGVSILALAPPVEAKIVYTPAHKQIGPNGSYALDLNHDGITDFSFSASVIKSTSTHFEDKLSVTPTRRNGVVGYLYQASALRPGVLVGPKRFFQYFTQKMAWVDKYCTPDGSRTCKTQSGGYWANVRGRYLGLTFSIHGKTHYGWACLNVAVSGSGIHTLITGYAYETVANKPILTGKTKGPNVITFQPATLGHLARGAFAIRAPQQHLQVEDTEP